MSANYYVIQQDQQQGPFTADEIRFKIEQREFNASQLAWHEGLTDWKPLGELFPDIHTPEPASPPTIEPATSQAPAPAAAWTPPAIPAKPKWYDHYWVIFGSIPLSLFCVCLPIGIIPLWLTKRFDKRTKVILSAVFSLPFLFIIMLNILSPRTSSSYTPSSNSYSVESPSGSSSSTPSSEPTASSVSWSEIHRIYGLESKYSDLQKDEEWKRFKGKRISWSGEVVEVSNGFLGGLQMQVKMNRNTLISDLIISLNKSSKEKAMKLSKGNRVRFTGKLDRWGTLMPISITDGEIE